MTKHSDHSDRVAKELRDAGASGYGANKFVSRYLPNIIHPEEHVRAVVYGRYKEDGGLLSFSSGMLVATDRRVFFVDHKPGYTSTDEITYDVVAGVKKTTSSFFSTVTLHTRVSDYTIRFANPKGVEKFVEYIESRRLETDRTGALVNQGALHTPAAETVDAAALTFLKEHDLGVLSTVDRTGTVHGAAIYYFMDKANRVCVLTKSGTQKARDIFAHQQVALTVYEAASAQTVQLHGMAEVVTDLQVQQHIMNELIKPRAYDGEMRLPPVTTIHKEGYVALHIIPTSARYTDYRQQSEYS